MVLIGVDCESSFDQVKEKHSGLNCVLMPRKNDSKKGGNAFQKTETKSWGLPLMNGGLKIFFIKIINY